MDGKVKTSGEASHPEMAPRNLALLPVPFPDARLLLSGFSATYLIDSQARGATLDVGDILRGSLRIIDIEDAGTVTCIGSGTLYNELTAVFEYKVTDKSRLQNGEFGYVFGPVARFAAELESLLNKPAGSLNGAMFAMFEDSAQNYSRMRTNPAQTREDLIRTANDGTYLYCFGYTHGNSTIFGPKRNVNFHHGEGVAAVLFSDKVAAAATQGNSGTLGYFYYGLNVIDYGSGPLLSEGEPSNFGPGLVVLSGASIATPPIGIDTPFDLLGDIDLTITPLTLKPLPGRKPGTLPRGIKALADYGFFDR